MCIHNLCNWHKRPHFQPVSTFDMPSSLNLLISSFQFKVRDIWLFLSLGLKKPLRVIDWPNFNIVVSKEIGKPKERLGAGGEAGQWSSKNTHIYWLCLLVMTPQNKYNSNIKYCWSQITMTNIIIMKMFEILQELPMCDMETRNE